MPHAYTKDQQAERTLTRPLPAGENLKQPAKAWPPSPRPFPKDSGRDGLFAEQSALPNPQPGRSATILPVGARTMMRVRTLVALVSRLRATLERLIPVLPPDVIAAGVGKLTRQVPAGLAVWEDETRHQCP